MFRNFLRGRFKRWLIVLTLTISVGLMIGISSKNKTTATEGIPPQQTTVITECDDLSSNPEHFRLSASPETVHWGYFSKNLSPVMTVNSQDYVTVETITHHAGDDYKRMIAGDDAIEEIYHWTEDEQAVSNRGPGVHIMTGPIYICGAEPGDLLEVRTIDLEPRASANPEYQGKAFGSNAGAWWGFHYDHLTEEPSPREVITLYDVDLTGERDWAEAVYRYRWTPQTTPDGEVHERIDYPGIVVDHDTINKVDETLEGVKIPLRYHIGVMGVAPEEDEIVDSIPPSHFGGNIDNRNIGVGTSMYYPVSVLGALFSAGDAHAAQGDSELNGTAIEISMNGTLQFIVHKQADLEGTLLEGIDYPLLETPDSWMVHGFTYPNYLEALGEDAQKEIYEVSSVDMALEDSSTKMRDFLMNGMGLSEDEAYSLITVGTDFAITQVVDGNWGVHGILSKGLFDEETVKSKPTVD